MAAAAGNCDLCQFETFFTDDGSRRRGGAEAPRSARELYLVAPDDREQDVRAQLRRPAFHHVSDLRVRFLPYGELERNRDVMARFGSGLKAIQAAARMLT